MYSKKPSGSVGELPSWTEFGPPESMIAFGAMCLNLSSFASPAIMMEKKPSSRTLQRQPYSIGDLQARSLNLFIKSMADAWQIWLAMQPVRTEAAIQSDKQALAPLPYRRVISCVYCEP